MAGAKEVILAFYFAYLVELAVNALLEMAYTR
jgi:hypothetical protein